MGISKITEIGALIANHFYMFIEKILQLFNMLFSWIFGLFSVSGNYEFISLFSNIFLIFFLIGVGAIILSYWFGNVQFVKEWIGNNSFNSPITLGIKTIVFMIAFIFIYLMIDSVLSRVIVNVQAIQEEGFIISKKKDDLIGENGSELDRKVKFIGTFLNGFEFNPNISNNYTVEKDFYFYKEMSLGKTKINFSPNVEKSSGKSEIRYSMGTIGSDGSLSTQHGIINLFTIQDLFINGLEHVKCSDGQTKLENITNYGGDVYGYLLNNSNKKEELKNNVLVSDTIQELSKIYSKIKKNYIITNSNSIESIFSESEVKTEINQDYISKLKNLFCLPNFKENKKENNKKEEKKIEKKKKTEGSENTENEPTGEENKLVEDFEIKQIKDLVLKMKSSLLYLSKFSEKSNKEFQKENNRFIFINTILDLFNNISGTSASENQPQTEASNETEHLKTTKYIKLVTPLVIDIENGDKIVNYGMCFNYVFNSDLISNLKLQGFSNLARILNTGCGVSFGWLYDYTGNNIDKLGTTTFSRIVNNIEDGKSNMFLGYEDYGMMMGLDGTNLVSNNSTLLGTTNKNQESLSKLELLPDYKEKISKVSGIIKLINSYKNLMFSLFLYLLPGVFIVLILKFIKLSNH